MGALKKHDYLWYIPEGYGVERLLGQVTEIDETFDQAIVKFINGETVSIDIYLNENQGRYEHESNIGEIKMYLQIQKANKLRELKTIASDLENINDWINKM